MEEEEICRVCRSEATLEQPLFHPCKCSGSIRNVHQDCLIEWLSHSKKKYCELCEHPFIFTPVFRQDMPQVLPAKLFLLQIQKKVAFGVIMILRAILVSCIWLIILPYFTIWIWRLYFFLGSNISKQLSKLQHMKHQLQFSNNLTSIFNYNNNNNNNNYTIFTNNTLNHNITSNTSNWILNYKSQFTLKKFLADCFEGQIITCIVIFIFVVVFLLREWIIQNIPVDNDIVQDIIENQEIIQPIELQNDQQNIELNNQQIDQRFDSLFDLHSNQNQLDHSTSTISNNHSIPSSPTILNNQLISSSLVVNGRTVNNDPIWFNNQNRLDQPSSSNSDNNHKSLRASSMPPLLSSSHSFQNEIDSNNININQSTQDSSYPLEFQRSASMEPFLDRSTSSELENIQFNSFIPLDSNLTSQSQTIPNLTSQTIQPLNPPNPIIQRGQPPNAPLMGHARLVMNRPIWQDMDPNQHDGPLNGVLLEEDEEDEIVNNNNNRLNENDDDEDDDDENMEEFEGVLEAIGMQGSLLSLAQNCALMILLIALSLGAAVWIPYLIGMVFIMTEISDFVRLPLKLARLITDPLVDLMFFISTDYIAPWIVHLYHFHFQSLFDQLSSFVLFQHLFHSFSHILNQFYMKTDLISDTSFIIPNGNSTSIVTSIANFMNETEPWLEVVFRRYQALATGQTTMDRFCCIVVGYLIVTTASCWYLARSTNNNMAVAAFGQTAQEALRHQGIIFKVGMFITIELVLFPIICGFLLDFIAFPLFESVTWTTRIVYLKNHPIPSIFIHWFLGTGFMFLFAVLITLCREVVRPGVLWFIRDPNDPQFHPIREIAERPILFQFKKIGASALIYIAVILVGVGGVVHATHAFTNDILPLRWDLSHTLSTIPIDLIAVQLFIPTIVNYLKLKQMTKNLFIKWMTAVCYQLRLTSFIFGGRHPEEEGNLIYHSWSAWLQHKKPTHYPAEGVIDNIIGDEVSYIWSGRLLRVPRHDSVPIIEPRRMLVPLDNYTLQPLIETERILGHPAATAPGGDEINTVIVYSPPGFRRRVYFFIGFMWFSMTVFICSLIAFPTLLGRLVFKDLFLVESNVHDIYSCFVGCLIVLVFSVLIDQIVKAMNELSNQPTLNDTLSVVWKQLKQWNSWIFRWVFFAISFGIVIPVLCGILIELYFVLPLKKLGANPPTLELLSVWSYGFSFLIIMHGSIQFIPNNRLNGIVNSIFQGGIYQMKIGLCFKKLLIPLILLSITAIGAPYGIAYLNMHIIAQDDRELRIKLIQLSYCFTLIGAVAFYLGKLSSDFGTRLVQSIREDNYLIGRTLHNFEQ